MVLGARTNPTGQRRRGERSYRPRAHLMWAAGLQPHPTAWIQPRGPLTSGTQASGVRSSTQLPLHPRRPPTRPSLPKAPSSSPPARPSPRAFAERPLRAGRSPLVTSPGLTLSGPGRGGLCAPFRTGNLGQAPGHSASRRHAVGAPQMPAERQPPRPPTAPLTDLPAHLAMNADLLQLPPPEVPASLPARGHAPGSVARVGKARAEPGSV